MLKGVIFDLDGVITDTAELHFKAWSECAKSVGINLPREFEENLKGIDRVNSLKAILKFGNVKLNEEEFNLKLKEKNDNYVASLKSLSKNDILPGIESFLKECKSNNLKIALASVSKNAPYILKQLGLFNNFDYICDPSTLKNGKPDPEIFINCANALGLKINECIGIEDAIAGVASIKSANMYAVGIGNLSQADQCFSSTKDLKLKDIKFK